MRLKYYLRGLGLGIIFTVIIMMIALNARKEKTEVPKDTEVSTVIADVQKDKDTEVDTQTVTPEDTVNQDATVNQNEVTLVIVPEDVARTVGEKLQGLGVIADAEDFRLYLKDKGVASNIHNGEFIIPKNASYDQIISIITGR